MPTEVKSTEVRATAGAYEPYLPSRQICQSAVSKRIFLLIGDHELGTFAWLQR